MEDIKLNTSKMEDIKLNTSRIPIIYENNKCIGYTTSIYEAEAICKKNPEYQWDTTKNIDIINKVQKIVLDDYTGINFY